MNEQAARSVSGSTRHVPLRRCVNCRLSLPQGRPASGLIRLVKTDDTYRLDLNRRLGGRGTWICRDCASGIATGKEKEKQVRRAFGAKADEVRELLQQALAANPARRSPVPGNKDGGVDVG